MRTTTVILALSLLFARSAIALDVTEREGGFRFMLPDDFSPKANPRKAASPSTQFSTHFSRASQCLVVPAGWRDASLDIAIATTVKLAADGFAIKVGQLERTEMKSKSGLPVTRILAPVQDGDIPFLVVVAFSPKEKAAVTYTFIPGKLDREAALKLVDATIGSLELER
jgi:hypothetical protein